MDFDSFVCGHPRSEANTLTRSNGRSRCRTCKQKADAGRDTSRRTRQPAPPPGEWVTRGACRDPKARLAPLFDPIDHGEAGSRETAERLDAAATLCGTCPVAAACRNHAREHKLVGTWGGIYFTTEDHKTHRAGKAA